MSERGKAYLIRLRQRLSEAQNHRCAYCGTREVPLTIDHVIPRSRGGRYGYANCVAACEPCNHDRDNRNAFTYFALKAAAQ